MNKLVQVFGLEIIDHPIRETINSILKLKDFSFVVTPNLQHIVALNNNPADLQCYQNASMILCDSRVVRLLSKLAGKPIESVIPGSDLTKYLFDRVLDSGDSIMVVGSSENEISDLQNKYALTNLEHYNPPMGFINNSDEVRKVINAVHQIKPRYLFLAVGFPRQEQLACKLKESADYTCTAFCIGASIDFLTGKQKRAPKAWQRLHLEWFYRFLQDPKRLFKRYFVDSWGIFPILLREIRKKDD